LPHNSKDQGQAILERPIGEAQQQSIYSMHRYLLGLPLALAVSKTLVLEAFLEV